MNSESRYFLILRLVFAALVLLCFLWSMHPVTPRDFYDALYSTLSKPDAKVKEAVDLAKEKQKKDVNLYPSTAFEMAAEEKGVDLTKYIKGGHEITCNKDVLSLVRKNSGSSIRLGLDLNGGAEFILELIPDESDSKDNIARAEKNFDRYRDIAIEILRNRLESQKIYECEISPSGAKFISLRAPLVSKDEKVKLMNLVQMSAKLQFRLVNKDNDRLVSQYQADPEKFVPEVGYEMLESLETHSGKKKPEKRVYFVQVKPEMDGRDISDAYLTTDQFGQRQISLEFNASGAKIFGDVTRANVGRQMAIVLDGKLYSAPVIRDAIEGGHAVITGQFSKEEGENISNALVSGSLPVKIKLDAVFDTDPSLGAESLRQSMWAGIISLVLIIGFMIVYYMKSGIVASIALVFNMIMLLGAMAAFECTLTLPGIAGIILTLGMAVDGNIIIYERIREELLKGKSVLSAIEIGFSRSFLTVVDANITTLIVGVILMWVGTGPVKGFGVTLSIGIITTLFCSLFISRLCFDTMGWIKPIKSLRMHQFFKKPNLDVLSIQKYNIGVSIFLVILSFAVVGVRGKGVLGVDFTGGSLITMNYEKRVPEADVQKTVAAAGYNNAKITYKASGTGTVRKLEIVLPEKDISKEQLDKKNLSPKEVIMEALNSHYQDAKFSGGQETHIGGLIGWEFTKLAMLAIFLSFFLIIIYVSLRFELAYGVASVIALLHDTTITMGVFFLFGKELSMPVIAAILTVIGYSINDTIIIFDRIRENTKLLKGKSYYEIINTSINETLSRTVLTSTLTALVVLVLFMIGEVSINDFSLVLLFGIVIGTYSSIYIASPVVNIWHKKVNKIPDAA